MPLYDSTYIWCCVSESHSGATLGEKDWGSAESTDKAWSESCRGSVQRRDRAATWQKVAERDHFLTLSLIRLCRPSLHPPPGHPWHGLVISRCTDGYCVYKCVYFCVDWGSCLSRSELFWQVQLPRTYLQLLLRFWEQSLNQSVGMRRVKAHALIYTHSLTVLEYK